MDKGSLMFLAILVSWIRIVSRFLFMMVYDDGVGSDNGSLLIPWPYERIPQGNVYSHVTGKMLTQILGNPRRIEGVECSREKAISICNHCSPIDVFPIMWLVPSGTVGIAKNEIIWYPLSGQLYVPGQSSLNGPLDPNCSNRVPEGGSGFCGSKPVVVDHYLLSTRFRILSSRLLS